MTRFEVYKIIDGERAYQLERHRNHNKPHRDEGHSVADWIIYMEYQIQEAKLQIYDLDIDRALENVRKITALGVACMEYNETPPRDLA